MTNKRSPDGRKGKAVSKRPVRDAFPNQWQATDQQIKFIDFYLDPKSPSFGNAYQSAISAGFGEEYAKKITAPSVGIKWVQQAYNIMKLQPDHLKASLQRIVTDEFSKDSDKIAAIKLLGQEHNMFTEKRVVGVVGIEQALAELE